EGFAEDEVRPVQGRRRNHRGRAEERRAGGHSIADPDAAGSIENARSVGGNDEARMTNDELMTKLEVRSVRHWSFEFPSSLESPASPASQPTLRVIRYSSFAD